MKRIFRRVFATYFGPLWQGQPAGVPPHAMKVVLLSRWSYIEVVEHDVTRRVKLAFLARALRAYWGCERSAPL